MPKSQRSRACTQCRERRVKCDETPELCNQCRRLGLPCSGPIVGSVIIDMTDRVAKPKARKKKTIATSNSKPTVVVCRYGANPSASSIRRDSTQPKSEPSEGGSPMSAVSLSNTVSSESSSWPVEAEKVIAAIRYQYQAPTLYEPHQARADALDVAFMSHFVQLNQSSQSYTPEIPWLTHLPTLHSNSVKPAVRLSVRAASMAFFAKVHNDPTILVDSYRWYTVSLNAQRMSLARLGGQRIPDDEEILVPIILGLYEVYAGTTSDSVLLHVAAAAEIIKLRGPDNCRSGIVWPLFKAMRVSDSQKALIFNKPSVFASPDWMTLPFLNMTKNAHHCLADIMLMVPECINLCGVSGSLRSFFASPLPPGTDLEPCRDRTKLLIEDLDAWALSHPYLASFPTNATIMADGSGDTAVVCSSPPSPQQQQRSNAMRPPDSFIALSVATYECVRIILTLLLHKLEIEGSNNNNNNTTAVTPNSTTPPTITGSSPPLAEAVSSPENPSMPPQILLDLATRSADTLLHTTKYLETTKSVGFDFIRSVTPLVVVAILGPQQAQIAQARGILERWGVSRGLGGLVNAWLYI